MTWRQVSLGSGSSTASSDVLIANIVASEALAAGDQVAEWSNSGVTNVRKADASDITKEAIGFVKTAVSIGGTAVVYRRGKITTLSGLTPSAPYFLSDTTPGGITSTAVTRGTGVDKLHQLIGFAIDATTLNCEPREAIILKGN